MLNYRTNQVLSVSPSETLRKSIDFERKTSKATQITLMHKHFFLLISRLKNNGEEIMKKLLVLGAGAAGTMVVNKLRKKLPKGVWEITVIDQDTEHIYQPGLLLMPFGTYEPAQLMKKRQSFFPKGVDFIQAKIEKIKPELNLVVLEDGREIAYDLDAIGLPRTDEARLEHSRDGKRYQ